MNFWRNGFLSFAAIIVITLSLTAFGALIFGSAFGKSLLADVKDKVDINVYFNISAPETDILAFQKEVEAQPGVTSVVFVTRDQALSDRPSLHDRVARPGQREAPGRRPPRPLPAPLAEPVLSAARHDAAHAAPGR